MAAVVMFPAMALVIWVAIYQLQARHAAAVHVVWYLFSLSTCAAAIAFYWVHSAGAIDAKGQPAGDMGRTFLRFLTFTLDLNTDLVGLTALVGLIVLPQFISYVLSGVFGCASRPRLVTYSVHFFSWGLAKSLAIASGVLLVLSLTGYLNGWDGFSAKSSATYVIFSEMLLAFAFVALMGKTTLDEIPLFAKSRRLRRVRHAFVAVDKFMTRNRPDAKRLEWAAQDGD